MKDQAEGDAIAIPGVDVTDADERSRDGATLVDVRDQHEWDAGHAPQALHVPLHNLDPAALPVGPVLVVCRSGGRSSAAAKRLAAAGVDVLDVDGGMEAWAEAGLPLIASGARKGATPEIA